MNHLKDMMEQIKKIKNGVGVQSLIDSAYKILENPIVMFNTEYNLLAYSEGVTDDSIWNEIVTHGKFSTEMQNFFYNEGFIEEVANPSKITLLRSEKLKYDRIWGKLLNKNDSHVANLMIVSYNRPFEENDLMIFEIICKLISRAISKNEFYQEYEQAHQEILIKNLIDRNN